jgi:hypothetical protein
MNDAEPSLLSILINWLPFFVFLGSMIYLSVVVKRYTRERSKFHSATLEILSRIATAIEKRQ